jgi:glycosyltransferase involved in cell wall biosynthesis
LWSGTAGARNTTIQNSLRRFEGTASMFVNRANPMPTSGCCMRFGAEGPNDEVRDSRQSIGSRDPRVSVVLPTYNGQRYLRDSIDSVLTQTDPDFEFIIVDDCSTDETSSILEGFATRDKRIRIVRNPSNQKLPRSLNVGFSLARGKYFTWTSDDNLFEPHAFATMANYLDRHPEVGVVFSDYIQIDEAGRKSSDVPVVSLERLPVTTSNAASFMHRREVFFELGGYDTNWFLVEDFDFLLRAVEYSDLGVIRESLYRYRVHDTSLSATRATEINDKIRLLLEQRLPKLTRFSRKSIAFAWAYQAERNYRAGKLGRTIACTIRSFCTSPYYGCRATKELVAGYWRGYRARRRAMKLQCTAVADEMADRVPTPRAAD